MLFFLNVLPLYYVDCIFLRLRHYTPAYTAWKMSKYIVFSGPYFPAFGLNTERYKVSLPIQSECGKIPTRKNFVFRHISRSVSAHLQLLIYNGDIDRYWYISDEKCSLPCTSLQRTCFEFAFICRIFYILKLYFCASVPTKGKS